MKYDNVYVTEENPNSSKYTLRKNVPEVGRHKSTYTPHLEKSIKLFILKVQRYQKTFDKSVATAENRCVPFGYKYGQISTPIHHIGGGNKWVAIL